MTPELGDKDNLFNLSGPWLTFEMEKYMEELIVETQTSFYMI